MNYGCSRVADSLSLSLSLSLSRLAGCVLREDLRPKYWTTLSCQISRFVYPGVSPLFATGLHQLASSSQVGLFLPPFSLSRLLLSIWRCLKRGFIRRCLAVMNYGCSRIADSLSLCRWHIRGRFETKLMLLFGLFCFFSSARIWNFCCLIEQTEQQMLCVFSFVFPFVVYSLSFFSNWFVYRFTC
jgi:hypothetical protein